MEWLLLFDTLLLFCDDDADPEASLSLPFLLNFAAALATKLVPLSRRLPAMARALRRSEDEDELAIPTRSFRGVLLTLWLLLLWE